MATRARRHSRPRSARRPARTSPPDSQVPGAAQALSSQATEEAGKSRLGKSCAPRDPNVPLARLCRNSLLPERRKRPAPTPRQRLAPGPELRRARAYSRKAPAGPGGEGGGVPKLSHQPRSRFPGGSPGPFLPRRLRQLSRLRTPGGPAAAPGQRELPARKVSSFSAWFPPRGPGLRARRAGRLAAAAPAAPEPGSRSCHRGGSAPARPRASLGPHRDLIGSASPRPCACSGRHLPCARPPELRLPRPSRPELPRLWDPLGCGTPTFRPAPSPLLTQHVLCGKPSFPGEGCSPGASPGPLWDTGSEV